MSSKASSIATAQGSQLSNAGPKQFASDVATSRDEGVKHDFEEFKVTKDSEMEGEEEVLELPALPANPGSDGDEAGKGLSKGNLPSEIPDSDVVSPWASPVKEARVQEFVGGLPHRERGETEASVVVEGETRNTDTEGEVVGDDIDGIGESTETGNVEASALTNMLLVPKVSASAQLRPAGSNSGESEEAATSQIQELDDLQALPVDGLEILPKLRDHFTDEAQPVQDSVLTEEHPAANWTNELISRDEQPPRATRALCFEDNASSSVQAATDIESPPSNEVEMLVVHDSLPIPKASFLQKALQEDEASGLQGTPTPAEVSPENNVPTTKTIQRSKIPASDDEENAMDEDTDPSPGTVEFHKTSRSASGDPNTLSMDVQTTEEKEDESAPALPLIVEPIMHIFNDTDRSTGVDFEMENSSPIIDTAENTAAPSSVSELPQHRTSAVAPLSQIMDLDWKEASPVDAGFSSLIKFPPLSVNVPDLVNTKVHPIAVGTDLPSAPLSTKEEEEPMEVPAPSAHPPSARREVSSSTPSTQRPQIDVASSQIDQHGLLELAILQTELLPQSPPAEATQAHASLWSSVPTDVNDAKPSDIASSPPRLNESMAAPMKPKIAPSISFAAPNESVKASQSIGKRKAASTAPNQIQAQAKTYTTPKKMADTVTSQLSPDKSPSKDVLYEELKAMKIASIQARNASLEIEIAAKRTILEEIVQELENPAAETVKKHIKLLHDYNDIRDVGQGLVGMIADNRGVRIGELYDEFGVGLKD
ncbi:DNA repair [Hyphodiscus hymeniophilus]|uniref:DNA repair n=1 Tax=Hyphodiscus hymeniophilus TaxID=353542 RepID=A0A9P6VRS3_9HELO|nr:DNA repair [Hyphodiscus hymeniophilus]